MALLTYSDSDPGWSASGTGGAVNNLGGITGAFLADIFFSLIGYAAYLVPVLPAYRAVSLLLADDDHQPVDWQLWGFRALGLLLLVVAATALGALNDNGDSGLPQGAGGIVGAAIGAGFDQAFNPAGARLVLVTLFLLGLTVFADISWLRVIDWLGHKVIEGTRYAYREGLAWLDRAGSSGAGEAARGAQSSDRTARGQREKARATQDQAT